MYQLNQWRSFPTISLRETTTRWVSGSGGAGLRWFPCRRMKLLLNTELLLNSDVSWRALWVYVCVCGWTWFKIIACFKVFGPVAVRDLRKVGKRARGGSEIVKLILETLTTETLDDIFRRFWVSFNHSCNTGSKVSAYDRNKGWLIAFLTYHYRQYNIIDHSN